MSNPTPNPTPKSPPGQSLAYVSTRGDAPKLNFPDVLLAGLAQDGGLYVPERWPSLPSTPDLFELSYEEVATEIMWPFLAGTWQKDEFAQLVADAYSGFGHPQIAPLVSLGDPHDNLWLMELFWGPTLAFKDIALQLVGRLFDAELSRRGQQVTIVGATSGDTGSAAIQACRDKDTIDIFILHPHGRTSDLQRRQMTTVNSPTVFNIAIEGSFDDCQDIAKALFGDADLREQLRLSSVNSINWARVMAQIVYYVWAQLRVVEEMGATRVAGSRLGLGGAGSNSRAPSRAGIAYSVPTGNFGNVYAGYCAHLMGLARVGVAPRFIVGTNSNDSLHEFFSTATLPTGEVTPTLSPSMDIMVPSNFERLIFEVNGRDGHATAAFMEQLRETGKAGLEQEQILGVAQLWSSWSCDDDTTLEIMRETYQQDRMLIDPHTAVGLKAALECRHEHEPTVVLGTAHPAKFPEAVRTATGVEPELPPELADLGEREEFYEVLPADFAVVRDYVLANARLGRG